MEKLTKGDSKRNEIVFNEIIQINKQVLDRIKSQTKVKLSIVKVYYTLGKITISERKSFTFSRKTR